MVSGHTVGVTFAVFVHGFAFYLVFANWVSNGRTGLVNKSTRNIPFFGELINGHKADVVGAVLPGVVPFVVIHAVYLSFAAR